MFPLHDQIIKQLEYTRLPPGKFKMQKLAAMINELDEEGLVDLYALLSYDNTPFLTLDGSIARLSLRDLSDRTIKIIINLCQMRQRFLQERALWKKWRDKPYVPIHITDEKVEIMRGGNGGKLFHYCRLRILKFSTKVVKNTKE